MDVESINTETILRAEITLDLEKLSAQEVLGGHWKNSLLASRLPVLFKRKDPF
jgi:hypothetical protein